MKFKLGQKVKYKRISKKIIMGEHYLNPDDFTEYEGKSLERRESIKLEKERIGYIAGRRRFTFRTYFQVEYRDEDSDLQPGEWVCIVKQEYGFAYLIAYTMGKTNYVLEDDLRGVN